MFKMPQVAEASLTTAPMPVRQPPGAVVGPMSMRSTPNILDAAASRSSQGSSNPLGIYSSFLREIN